MKYAIDCPTSKPTAAFNVRIDRCGNPVLNITYKRETIDLFYVDVMAGCRTRLYGLPSRHVAMLEEVGFDFTQHKLRVDD